MREDERLSGTDVKVKVKDKKRESTKKISPMALKLLNDIDKYDRVYPTLKYVRGEDLTTDHWAEMFILLGLPKHMTLEKLHFGDILDVSDSIIINAEAIKELNMRAQGEVAIRDAIRDLDAWGATTTFSLKDHTDTNDRQLKLINNWKDIITQVGDHQTILSSLKDSPYYKGFADKANI